MTVFYLNDYYLTYNQGREKKREAFMWKAVDVNAKPIIIENKEMKKDQNVKVVHANQRSFKVFFSLIISALSFFLSFFFQK